MVNLLDRKDPRVVDVHPGVMQLHDFQTFQHATLNDGSTGMVRFDDPNVYEVENSDGSLESNTYQWCVSEPGQPRRRCRDKKD